MKLTIPHPAIHGTFCAELDESRNVQVHVFRARARYCCSFALVKKKIYMGMRLAIPDTISAHYIPDRLNLLRLWNSFSAFKVIFTNRRLSVLD
jgi:hypothetical protein